MDINRRNMAFTVALFLGGAMLLTSYVTDITSWEAWVPALLAFFLSFAVVSIYLKLTKKYPEKHLPEIFVCVFGKCAGYAVSWAYVFFFLVIACFNTYSVSSFFVGYVMPETPDIVFTVIFVFICSRAVRLGIENITKISIFIFFLISLFIILNFILLLSQMKISNFLPLFDHSFYEYLQAAHTELMNPFGETVVFLMFADKIKNNDFRSALIWGIIIGGVMLMLVVIRSVAVLGVTISISAVPSYEVLRLINIKNMITRIETLYSFLLLILGFFKVSIIYCAISRLTAYLTGLKTEKSIINSVGAFLACMTAVSFTSGFDSVNWGTKYAAFFATPFVFIIPCFLLLVITVKRKGEKAK
ncbi:MAG: endospore germination permease [Clostridia bacterium]|nr:endospore germination permease [Clostridia bacterium]